MKEKIIRVVSGFLACLLLLCLLGATGKALYYKVNDAAADVDIGPAVMVIRDDALTTLTPADGDYVRGRVNSKGALWVDNVNTATPTAKTPVSIVVACTTPSTDTVLIGSETFIRALYLQARRTAGDNTGNVFVGLAADLDQGTKEYFELTPGATYQLEMPSGTKVNLGLFSMDADTAADGVVGWYIPE